MGSVGSEYLSGGVQSCHLAGLAWVAAGLAKVDEEDGAGPHVRMLPHSMLSGAACPQSFWQSLPDWTKAMVARVCTDCSLAWRLKTISQKGRRFKEWKFQAEREKTRRCVHRLKDLAQW